MIAEPPPPDAGGPVAGLLVLVFLIAVPCVALLVSFFGGLPK